MSKRPKKTNNAGHFLFNISQTEYEIIRLLLNEYIEGATAKQVKKYLDNKARTNEKKPTSLVYLWRCIHHLEDVGLVQIDEELEYVKRMTIPEKIKEPLGNSLIHLTQLQNEVKEVRENRARKQILEARYLPAEEIITHPGPI